jgi:electron transfer flavoprotein beta subunit
LFQIRVRGDKKGVELANVKMAMNPFCEIAMEAAVDASFFSLLPHIVP